MRGRRLGSLVMSVACALTFAGVAYSLVSDRSGTEVRAASAEAKHEPNPKLGPSGLELPRFVSLKTDVVNVRRGPSNDHEVAWVFRRKGLPVEIIAEFEHWRRIRDSEGEEGWVYQSLLTGNRTAIVEPWRKGTTVALRTEPQSAAPAVAMLKSGVIAEVEKCTGQWCELSVSGYDGWIDQATLFGVYPGETLDD
jgi:SH3-like domain-containing protein